MIGTYARERVTLKRWTGNNEYGDPVFSAVPILARVDRATRVIRNDHGALVDSDAMLLTEEPVTVLDSIVIDGREFPVLKVRRIDNVAWNLTHYEVFV